MRSKPNSPALGRPGASVSSGVSGSSFSPRTFATTITSRAELRGKREIGLWIDSVVKGAPEIYTVLDWYKIDGDTVTFHHRNRRDNPSTESPPLWDFPGMSIAVYAGGGLWSYDEDFWDAKGARRTTLEYADARERAGVGHKDLPGVTKERELAELLGRELR